MWFLRLVEHLGRGLLRLRGVRSRMEPSAFGRLHVYEAAGRAGGPTLVLLHGIAAGGSHYSVLMLLLRRHFGRVIVPDLLGHGFSEDGTEASPESVFASLTEVLDRLIEGRAVVLGNSLGGALALQYAQARPEKVSHLLLLSPAGAPMTPEELGAFLTNFDLPTAGQAVRFVRRLYHAPPLYAWLIAPGVRDLFAREWMRRFIAAIKPEHFQTRETIAALTVPTVLWWGRSEKIMPAAMLPFWKEHLGEVREPEGFGHCPQLDRPWALARAIRDAVGL